MAAPFDAPAFGHDRSAVLRHFPPPPSMERIREIVARINRPLRMMTWCSGIGAPEEAVRQLGLNARLAAYAEIDPAASAVLAARHPRAAQLGDLTASDFVERAMANRPYDLVVGGLPCQAFSVAGARKGLVDPRGNLTLRALRLLDDLRVPLFVYENVPGILSDGTGAFGSLLAGLCGGEEALPKPRNRKGRSMPWPTAGIAEGPERVLCWRVLDAQHWGKPQCRRRVFLVAATRASTIDPTKILFDHAA